MHPSQSPYTGRAATGGFTLIEILIALAISMVIAAAMASLFSQSVKSRQQVDSDGQRIESGRYVLDILADELRHAGFYGDYLPRSAAGLAWPVVDLTGSITWTKPQPCAIAVANLGWDNASGAITVPVHIMGYEAHTATLPVALTGCLPNYKSNTDVVVIRRVSTVAYARDAAGATVGDVFLQASNCATENIVTPFILQAKATGGSNYTLRKVNCSTSALSNINKYVVRIYYVATCDDCGNDTTPTLKVSELVYDTTTSAMAMKQRSVAPGVENMHFEYGIDISGDGVPDSFAASNNDPITTSPGFNWHNVMSVKAYVLIRDFKTTAGYSDGRSYVLGGTTIAAPGDDYKRSVFSTTVRLMSPSGAREPS